MRRRAICARPRARGANHTSARDPPTRSGFVFGIRRRQRSDSDVEGKLRDGKNTGHQGMGNGRQGVEPPRPGQSTRPEVDDHYPLTMAGVALPVRPQAHFRDGQSIAVVRIPVDQHAALHAGPKKNVCAPNLLYGQKLTKHMMRKNREWYRKVEKS